MLTDYIDLIEKFGLRAFFVMIFLLIGLAIHDVLKKGNVPFFGRAIVWLVLFVGCVGFLAKGVIEYTWTNQHTG